MRIPIFVPSLVLGAAAGLAACTQTADRSAQAPPIPAEVPAAEEVKATSDQAFTPAPPIAAAAPSAAVERDQELRVHSASAAKQAAVMHSMRRAEREAIYPPMPPPFSMPQAENRENYAKLEPSPVRRAAEQAVSTFSVDVDTGAYANVRRYLSRGALPPQDAVRVEELINYFDYGYTPPRERGQPFSVTTEIAPTPWNDKTHLLHVGIQGWVPETKPAGSNLVFLVDVSGSMQDPDKLPLVKTALKMLVNGLGPKDRISLVVYAGASGVVLEPTAGDAKATIISALERLEAGGSTNGGAGIELAYAMAKQGWIEGGVNRVLLATDGDFNVGVTRFESLLDRVKEQREMGIALTTLGFGEGNYNDHLMEQLADAGDGNYAYIDSAQEAHKVLVRQREATLTTIARDVKIQIEFNPAQVSEYRLIGYENRALNREDFANDAVDAGDIGAGHTVTALYEIALSGSGGEKIEPLRYGRDCFQGACDDPLSRERERSRGEGSLSLAPTPTAPLPLDSSRSLNLPAIAGRGSSNELAHLRLRYKRPEDGAQGKSHLIERALSKNEVRSTLANASGAFRFAAAVAAFGQLLSGGVYAQGFDYTDIERLARDTGEDRFGDRAEFRKLVQLAGSYALASRGEIKPGG